MALRARSILLLLGAGFLVVFASLYLLRLQIAEELLLYALQDRGIDAAFSVTVLDGDRMTIEDLAAADGSFGAERIDIAYRLDEVVDGKVTVVTVAGLTARVDLSEGAPSLPDLSSPEGPSADQREEETFFDLAQLDLPIITLDTATIEAETPLGPATIRASGEAWPDPSGARAGFLDFEVEAPTVGSLSGTLSAALEENGSILGDLTVEGGHLSLPAASLAGLAGQGSLAWIPGDKPALDIRLGAERFDLLEGLLPRLWPSISASKPSTGRSPAAADCGQATSKAVARSTARWRFVSWHPAPWRPPSPYPSPTAEHSPWNSTSRGRPRRWRACSVPTCRGSPIP
jgi:hypothetical protein